MWRHAWSSNSREAEVKSERLVHVGLLTRRSKPPGIGDDRQLWHLLVHVLHLDLAVHAKGGLLLSGKPRASPYGPTLA